MEETDDAIQVLQTLLFSELQTSTTSQDRELYFVQLKQGPEFFHRVTNTTIMAVPVVP